MRDTSAGRPVFRRPDRHRVGGHGLHLVRAASNPVIVTPTAWGKQITAHIRLTKNDNTTTNRTVLPASLADTTRQKD